MEYYHEYGVNKNLSAVTCGLFYGTVPEFTQRDWGKPRNTSVRI